ncbi:MAG: Na+/H+ antiporter NhaC family protein [Chitinophagales bacterium]
MLAYHYKIGHVELDGTEHIELMMPVILNTISVILAASVFGDHCSPISDTTILSSLSSGATI